MHLWLDLLLVLISPLLTSSFESSQALFQIRLPLVSSSLTSSYNSNSNRRRIVLTSSSSSEPLLRLGVLLTCIDSSWLELIDCCAVAPGSKFDAFFDWNNFCSIAQPVSACCKTLAAAGFLRKAFSRILLLRCVFSTHFSPIERKTVSSFSCCLSTAHALDTELKEMMSLSSVRPAFTAQSTADHPSHTRSSLRCPWLCHSRVHRTLFPPWATLVQCSNGKLSQTLCSLTLL